MERESKPLSNIKLRMISCSQIQETDLTYVGMGVVLNWLGPSELRRALKVTERYVLALSPSAVL
jgi:hypothetical protein